MRMEKHFVKGEFSFAFFDAKYFNSGIAPPVTAQKYRLATLQYGENLRRYFSNRLLSIFRWWNTIRIPRRIAKSSL